MEHHRMYINNEGKIMSRHKHTHRDTIEEFELVKISHSSAIDINNVIYCPIRAMNNDPYFDSYAWQYYVHPSYSWVRTLT